MDAVDALKQGHKVVGILPRKLNGQNTPDWQTQDDARWWAADAAARIPLLGKYVLSICGITIQSIPTIRAICTMMSGLRIRTMA